MPVAGFAGSFTVTFVVFVPTVVRFPAAVSVALPDALIVTVIVLAVLATLTGTLTARIRSDGIWTLTFCVADAVRPVASLARSRTDFVPAGRAAVRRAPVPRRREPANQVSDEPVSARPASSLPLPRSATRSVVRTMAPACG